jgi:hypothetical protein
MFQNLGYTKNEKIFSQNIATAIDSFSIFRILIRKNILLDDWQLPLKDLNFLTEYIFAMIKLGLIIYSLPYIKI